MLTLYYKPTCPYCQKVMAMVDELSLEVEMKDISADEAARTELIDKGGKQQVPYLVDSEKEVAMYESDDILDFLEINYGNVGSESADGPRVHVSDATCVSCEG